MMYYSCWVSQEVTHGNYVYVWMGVRLTGLNRPHAVQLHGSEIDVCAPS